LCLAERAYGAARGVEDFAMLDISQGMGVGVVNGGQLLTGHSGLAGELGHVTVRLDGRPCGCGNRGCLETEATDTALAVAVSERLGRRVAVEEIIELVPAGKLQGKAEFARGREYLAVGLAAAPHLFNPPD